MKQKIMIKSAKSSLVMGLIVSIIFLLFGIFFFYLIMDEPESYIGQSFLIIWMIVVLILIIYFIYSLKNYDKYADIGSLTIYKDDLNVTKSNLSFDEKLIKLDNLRKQELISKEEYDLKRKEILNQKW